HIGMQIGRQFSKTRLQWIDKFISASIAQTVFKKRKPRPNRWGECVTSQCRNNIVSVASRWAIIDLLTSGIRWRHRTRLRFHRREQRELKTWMSLQFRSI